ncbi:amidase [Phreatobacter cathodiphilus]|uniref:Amidase n=2 Tax=Phreatobacter cathodiphilus TaxID=1868589 RepID=A0A2S0NHH2_9HYPH|nr:amidase [Phreatobacter cathodiphilus]
MAALVRTRCASPVEILDDLLDRIAALEPRLNAFVAIDVDGARAAAHEAEAAVMRGKRLGPLHGVPVTIKDVQAVAGLPTRRGSWHSDPAPAAEDAPAVARLRAAGAVILGKTTTTEQGWTAVSENPLTGATDNPWKRGRTAGGSSSGAAALAAAGCGPLHLGTDGAGSVRLPAHFCGVVGFKPTFGMVPYLPVPNNGGLSHIGPIARDPADAELMLEVMAGQHSADYTTLPGGFRRDPAGPDLTGLRIAYSPDLGHARVDPEIAGMVEAAVRAFERLGAAVETVAPAWGPLGPRLIRDLWGPPLLPYAPADAAAEAAMDQGFVACLRESGGASWRDVQAAQARRHAYAGAVGRWFGEGWDLLVTPAASVAAFPHGRQVPDHWPGHAWDWLTWAEFSYPFNLAHCPAVSVPCGLTQEGLPVGLQIAGPRLSDPLVMRAARAFLAARPFPAWTG